MSEFIRLQANGADAYPDASTENTYRPNGTSVESALVNLESNVTTLGGVAGEAKTLAEQNSVKIATAEQEISDINSSLEANLNVRYNPETYYIQILIDNEWVDYAYFNNKEIAELIPIMTSDTSSTCSFSASSIYTGGSGFDAYKAHDGNDESYWCSRENALPAWLKVTFNNPKTVKKVYINNFSAQTIVVQASNDDNTWIDLITVTPNKTITSDVNNDTAYKYYRLYSTNGYTSGSYKYFVINDFQLYGY